MPLQKILFKPGINRENTRYTTEGGWYDGDKIRFRQGTPEMIGGWQQVSNTQFLGTCRSLWVWSTLGGNLFTGIGTNLKFYIEDSSLFYDVTPIRSTVTLTNPFTAAYSTLSASITSTDTSLTVASGTAFTSSGVVLVGTEKIAYTAKSTNTLSGLTRGYDGTTAAAHSSGDGVGSYLVKVADTAHGCNNGDFVTFSGATGLGGNITATVLNEEYQVTVIDVDSYSIDVGVAANATDVAGSPGGGTVTAAYQIHVGPEVQIPLLGWGSGGWGSGTWGNSEVTDIPMRIWSQTNWGQNLVFSPTNETIYYWNVQDGTASRGVAINTGLGGDFTVNTATPSLITFADVVLSEGTTITVDGGTSSLADGVYYVRNPQGNTCNLSVTAAGALVGGLTAGTGTITLLNDCPVATTFIFVSDTYRFLMAFGCNPLVDDTQDPMVIRWADQESLTDWYPSTSNQAGELRLSHGSAIVSAIQTRQEILTITDSAVYSLQYVGPPFVWGAQLMADNTSIMGQNCAVTASGVVYWMGLDKFYKYDGRVQTLRCDLRKYIFQDINMNQQNQIFAGTVEAFNEVWWFYCSANSDIIDRYAVYNYAEDIWYYGTMSRTAWVDSGLVSYPLAADTNNRLVEHENGLNDASLTVPVPIESYITSSEFDIGDGHNFGFIWRILPDITFSGSTSNTPSVTMTLYPLLNSGSGYLVPASEGGTNYATVSKAQTVNVEAYSGQVLVRVRGRQMAFKVSSDQLNQTWQLGAPRIDIKPDGRRGG